jgi:hypothetical protein
MHSTIKDILLKIESLNADLREEYDRLSEKYGFYYQKRKVIFLDMFRKKNREKKVPLYRYLIPTKLRHIRYILSIPFIYGIGIVVVCFDIFISLYQWAAFFLYRIPYVKRSDFIFYDRRFLDYLNILEKFNCIYCSYVNGVFAYAVEIGARTERFWCPIKAAHKPRFTHGWYKDFADYGDPDDWKSKMKDGEEVFIDSYGDKCFTK